MKSLMIIRPSIVLQMAADARGLDERTVAGRQRAPKKTVSQRPRGSRKPHRASVWAFFWDAVLRHGHAALAYLVLWAFFLVRFAYDARMGTIDTNSLLVSQNGTGLLLAFFCAWSAVAENFRFLFKRDEALFYGALPLGRGSLFAVMLASSVVPLLAGVGVLSLLLLGMWTPLGLELTSIAGWASIQALMLLTFCGIAVLTTQLTGRWAVAGALYVLANVYGAVLDWEFWMLGWLALPTLMHSTVDALELASPGYYLLRYLLINTGDGTLATNTWQYLAGSAAAGVACMVLAGVLFKRRDLEHAGDTFAFGVAHALTTILASVVLGLGLALLLCQLIFGGSLAILSASGGVPSALLALLAIACCGAVAVVLEAISGRSLHSMPRRLPNIVATLIVSAAIAVACVFDVTGAEHYVPDPSSVQSASLGSLLEVPLTNKDAIQATTELQQALISDYDERRANLSRDSLGSLAISTIRVSYNLNGGETVERQYGFVRPDGEQRTAGTAAYAVGQFLQSDAIKQQVKDTLEDALSTNAQRAIVSIGGNNTSASGEYWSSDSATYDTDETATTDVDVKVFPANYAALLSALEADIDEHGAACASGYAMAAEPGIYAQEWEAAVTIWSGFTSDANKSAAPMNVYLSQSDTPCAYQWAQETYGDRVFGAS